MADFHAIHSVGSSVVKYLRNAYPAGLPSCEFALLSSGELAEDKEPSTTLSLYLYRIGINEHLRNHGPANGPAESRGPLSLDLHYLLTIWAKSAGDEQDILGWARTGRSVVASRKRMARRRTPTGWSFCGPACRPPTWI